jgi:tripartite-type tricarboxylate transporter receptor subunit TctC
VKIIVPHAPGGVTDVVTRTVAQPVSEALGQPVVVENRPGAAGLLGTDMAAKAPADGYTLLMFVDTNTIFPSTVKQLQHDPVTSFTPITLLGRGSHVLVAHPSLPVANLQELIAYAKKHPRELSMRRRHRQSALLGFEIIKNTAASTSCTSRTREAGGRSPTSSAAT